MLKHLMRGCDFINLSEFSRVTHMYNSDYITSVKHGNTIFEGYYHVVLHLIQNFSRRLHEKI